MISSKVTSQTELRLSLEEAGFEVTAEKTNTGTFWRHKETGFHILVPKSVQGFYPDWLLADIHEQIGRLHLWSRFKPTKH